MTRIDVLRKALEALVWEFGSEPSLYATQTDRVITAIRAEIERLDAVEPVAWGVTYHASGEPTDLFFYEDEASIEAENCGWTARVVPLYPAPIAPSIPALTDDEAAAAFVAAFAAKTAARLPSFDVWANGAHWAYTLAAARTGARIIKADTLQELADDARQIELDY